MDFSILHLSDLHIVERDDSYSQGLRNLIDDVNKQCKNLKHIVLVITGDLIDKANYNDSTFNISKKFFEDLYSIIGSRVIGVEISPGNHDKERSEINRRLVNENRLSSDISEIDKKNWEYYLVSYKKYIELLNYIKRLFNANSKIIRNTYYVDHVNMKNYDILFINMDTSWSSFGGSEDKRKLCIEKNQLIYLKEEYQKILRSLNNPHITIMTAHHPLSWLKESDEAYIKPWLLNSEYFNIDFYLCGHTHDRQIQSVVDMHSSYNTLVTGFGWGEKDPSEEKDKHRYSIYNLSIKNNSCEIIIRKTCTDGIFDDDNDVLFTEEEKESKKKYFPIKPLYNRASIRIPVYVNNTVKHEFIFVDNNILEKTRKITEIFIDVSNHMSQFQSMHIRDFFVKYELNKKSKGTIIKQEVYDSYFYKNSINKEVLNLFSDIKNIKIIHENFISFLRELCGYLVYGLKSSFPAIKYIRLHFRKYYRTDNDDELYIAFCQATGESTDCPDIRDVTYKGMIQIAFDHNTSFVYIHNSDFNSLPQRKYENFITMAPNIYQNTYIVPFKKPEIKRPYISAALSITCDVESNILDILNYLGIGQFIFRLVFDYVSLFKIDLKKIVEEDI